MLCPILNVGRQVLPGVVACDSPLAIGDEIAHQSGGDGGCAEGYDAELAVAVCPYGIVDACDDGGDVEDMLCDLCRHDVAVVALRHCDEYLGTLDASAFQDIFVDSVANDAVAPVAGTQAAERLALQVDDGNVVSFVVHQARKRRADAPTA